MTKSVTRKVKIKKKHYFDETVEEAVAEYGRTISPRKKEIIFTKIIHPAFNHMVKVFVNKYKVCPSHITDITADEIISEGVAHLYAKVLSTYDPSKGKAYSYCTKSTINFCLQKRKVLYDRRIKRGELEEIDLRRNIMIEKTDLSFKEELSIFMDLWIEWYDKNMYKLYVTDKDLKIVNAILDLFRYRTNIEVFQKKNLYVLIREMSGYETNDITTVLRIVESHFFTMYDNYRTHDKLMLYNI